MTINDIYKIIVEQHKEGKRPTKVIMHPNDFYNLKDENGRRYSILMVGGLPVEIDVNCPEGKINVE